MKAGSQLYYIGFNYFINQSYKIFYNSNLCHVKNIISVLFCLKNDLNCKFNIINILTKKNNL